MTPKRKISEPIISRSSVTTEVNNTGSWRFVMPIYENKTAPCSAACPAGEDIGRIEMLARRGLFREAADTILMENPFPSVCGRVCFHPCENDCNRRQFDASVAIHEVERFLGDTACPDRDGFISGGRSGNGRRIAIIGSGPAGLSAGWFMSKLGFRCDVFEAKSEPGGLLRWGIPSYRLPLTVLQREIRRVETQGVNIQCNTPVDPLFIEKAKNRYDAVFVGCGYGRSIKMRIPGEEMADDGLTLLQQIRREDHVPFRGRVAVIGGGNTAVDVARCLLRRGASPILVYRRRKKDMPAFLDELDMALAEGVELMEMVTPIRIEAMGKDRLLTLQKMKVSEIEMGGRARVVPDGDPPLCLTVQKIVAAIGAEAEEPWQCSEDQNGGHLMLSHCRLIMEGIPIVYGGDLSNTVKSVADAVASGKQAAMAVDTFFSQGLDAIEKRLDSFRVGNGPALSMEMYTGSGRMDRNRHVVTYEEINRDYFETSPRNASRALAPNDRKHSFVEVEPTLFEAEAMGEVERCFNCGVCNECDNCRVFCPEVAVVCRDNRYINLQYCKGCGICVVECPRNAMTLVEDSQ